MSLKEALTSWRALLGEEFVITAEAARAEFETATFLTDQRIPAILRPGNREEVQACVRIAARCGTPIYPLSCGKNWGYGSRVPPANGSVVLALDRLDRIRGYDERLGYLTVEPGVTFAQAQRFLREQGSDLMLNSPGSTAEASIVGNSLERGIAGGLDGERARQICHLEVVLPSGECLETGFGHFTHPAAPEPGGHAPGPNLDGLFLQSNLGIVTELTLWLRPIPKFYQYFSFAIRSTERLPGLVDALQVIQREGLVETNFGLYNDYKLLTYLGRFPPGHAPETALQRGEFPRNFIAALEGNAWFGEGALTAPNLEIGVAKRRLLESRLRPAVDRLVFKEAGADNPLVGHSLPTSLGSAYWRKAPAGEANLDPDRDRCGVIWICPAVPFRGASVSQCVELIEETMREFPFEPNIGLQFHSPRAAHVIAAVLYDRERLGQDEQALACHDLLLRRLTASGFLPYRLSTRGMSQLPATGSYAEFLKTIKEAVDPTRILAPGRYEPVAGSSANSES